MCFLKQHIIQNIYIIPHKIIIVLMFIDTFNYNLLKIKYIRITNKSFFKY